jgi:hypothetical protein
MALEAINDTSYTLADIVDRILDKGLVINADITVTLVGVELLGIKIRASIASFETAAKYGLEFPAGTNFETSAWKETMIVKENCPQCEKKVPLKELMSGGCPWCGWKRTSTKIIKQHAPAPRVK